MSVPQLTIAFGLMETDLRRQAAKRKCSVAALVRKAVREFLDKTDERKHNECRCNNG